MSRPKRWEDCSREDLNMIPAMIERGWEPVFHPRDKCCSAADINQGIPAEGVSFKKNGYKIVRSYHYPDDGIPFWVFINLKENSTKPYSSLIEFLEQFEED